MVGLYGCFAMFPVLEALTLHAFSLLSCILFSVLVFFRTVFDIGASCLITFVIALAFMVGHSYWKGGIEVVDYDREYPKCIVIAAATLVLSFILYVLIDSWLFSLLHVCLFPCFSLLVFSLAFPLSLDFSFLPWSLPYRPSSILSFDFCP